MRREPLTDRKDPIALVLGGGGARGVAHIGVFKALQENGIPVDMMVGTSVGAFAASMWAVNQDWKQIRDVAFEFLAKYGFKSVGKGITADATGRKKKGPGLIKRFFLYFGKLFAVCWLVTFKSLISRRRLARGAYGVIPDKTFADADIPLAIVAADLRTGKEVVIREGSLRDASVASANLAGFFPPMDWGEYQLVDPSPVCSVPVAIARELGAARVIAIDIRSRVMPSERVKSGAEAIFRVAAMASERANDILVDSADVVIRPGVSETYWSDFHNLQDHVDEGERAALEVMPEIKKMVEELGR